MSQSNQTRGMIIYLDYNYGDAAYFILDLLTLRFYSEGPDGFMKGGVYVTTDTYIDLTKLYDLLFYSIGTPFIIFNNTGNSCNKVKIYLKDVHGKVWKFELDPVENCNHVHIDYVIFWEDMYAPFYGAADNWTDEVIRVTIYDNGDALITFLEGSGGYCHVIMWLPLSDVGKNDFLYKLVEKDYCMKCFSKLFPNLCKPIRYALLCKPHGVIYGQNFGTCWYYDPCKCEGVSCIGVRKKQHYGIGMIKRKIGKKEQKLFPIFPYYAEYEVLELPTFYIKDFWPFLKKSS